MPRTPGLPIAISLFGRQIIAHCDTVRAGIGGSPEQMMGLARRIRSKVRQKFKRPIPYDKTDLPMRVLVDVPEDSIHLLFFQPAQTSVATIEQWLALADAIEDSVRAIRSVNLAHRVR